MRMVRKRLRVKRCQTQPLSHTVEVVTNGINLALGVIIVLQIIGIGRIFLRAKPEVIAARAFLAERRFLRTSWLLLMALVIFTISNGFELYGDVMHIDWTVNEIIESVSLVGIMAALMRFRGIFRLALKAPPVPTVYASGR